MSEVAASIEGYHLAAASFDGVGIVVESEYDYANDALADIHGYDQAQAIIGEPWERLYSPVDESIEPSDLLSQTRETGRWRGDAMARRGNGASVRVELSIRATEDGFVCVVREQKGANGAGNGSQRTADSAEREDHAIRGPVEITESFLDPLDDVIYVVDEEDDLVEWNQQLNELLGYTDDELADMSLLDFLPEEYRELLGDEGTRMVDMPERAREMDVVAKDGGRIPVELRGATYADRETGQRYRVGIARDITARKEREWELERYETVLETVDDGVYILDEDLQVEMANERFFEMMDAFGFSREEVTEMHAHDLVVKDEERAALEATIEGAIENEPHTGSFEMSAETPDGHSVVCESRFRLYPEPRGEHRGCIGIIRDVTERKERERRLQRQRDELDTLNRINELLLAIAQDLFESSGDGEITQTVCDRLVASDLYQFAWIGRPDVGSYRLVPDASAGVDEDYVESITVTTDEAETGQGPGGRAFRSGELQVSQDIQADPTFEPWREAALTRDIRSAAAVPLTYDGTTYGILGVYASRPLAFSQREQRGFEILGEAIGYAINADRTRQLLFAEQVVELELQLPGSGEFVLDAPEHLGCHVSVDGYVFTGDDTWLLYLALDGMDPDRFVRLANDEATVETVRSIGADESSGLVALTVESTLFDSIASLGGRVTEGSIDDDSGTFTVEIPQSTDVGEFVELIRSSYPGTELLAKRDGEPPADQSAWLDDVEPADLTDRQRQALEAAYHAGYFEWPRESTAEDVADLLGVSRPTLQAHLRKAEAELLATFLDRTDGRGSKSRREPESTSGWSP